MRFIIQVRIEDHDSDGSGDHVVDVGVVERDDLVMGTLGLSINDAKALLAGVQDTIIAEQCTAALTTAERCADCGRRFAHKDFRRLVVRSLYGRVNVESPRWWTCLCAGGTRRSFTPLAVLLPSCCRGVPHRSLAW